MKNNADKELSYLPFLLTPEAFKILSFSFNFSFNFSMTSLQEGSHMLLPQEFSVVHLTVIAQLHQ